MTTHSQRPVRPGDVVHDEHGNPLRLEEKLGSGGQGTVWSVPNTPVAVKILHVSAGRNAEALRAQLRLVARLELSGIPIARPYTMLTDHVGYVMELLADMTGLGTLVRPGPDAPTWYRQTGGLRRRLRLLATTAEALTRLHGRAIAYGDVSPSNVLISTDTGHDHVWLIDPDNLTLGTDSAAPLVGTRGYQAPELAGGLTGNSTATDAFAFAELAFHVLVLAHPFKGDRVLADAELEDDAFAGKLPWIDHPADDANRATKGGVPRELALTYGLTKLFRRAFEEGLHDPAARPSMAQWCEALDRAAMRTIRCPGCEGSYYATLSECPFCSQGRPRLAMCRLYGAVPPQPDVPEFPRQLETGVLSDIVLTPGEPAAIRARSGLVCLDSGIPGQVTPPDEPLAELSWDGGIQVAVRRAGRHPAWLADPSGVRTVSLRTGEWTEVPRSRAGWWTVRFGPPEQVHRFARFFVQRTAA